MGLVARRDAAWSTAVSDLDDDGDLVAVRGTVQDVTSSDERKPSSSRHRFGSRRNATPSRPPGDLVATDFPAVDGYEFAARLPGADDETDIGGDWYDVFCQPDGRVVLAVATSVVRDLGGAPHGQAPACDSCVRMHRGRSQGDPRALDGFLRPVQRRGQIGLNLVRLDPESGRLELGPQGTSGVAHCARPTEFTAVPPGPPSASTQRPIASPL